MPSKFLFLIIPVTTIAFSVAACATSTGTEARNEELVRPNANAEVIGVLAFNVWTCKDLECLNLETSETTIHTYTACAAVMEDAQNVGVNLCETRKRASVQSSPAVCEPTGQACPDQRRGAYNWDDELGKRHDAGTADAEASDGGS